MSLQHLIGVNLEAIEIDAAAIRRLMAAAERNIADSHVKAIMHLGNAALQANGFRALSSKPGHLGFNSELLGLDHSIPRQTVLANP